MVFAPTCSKPSQVSYYYFFRILTYWSHFILNSTENDMTGARALLDG